MLLRNLLLSSVLLVAFSALAAREVRLTEEGLWVNGKPQPFLFGAEVQYFRARGGSGKNVARAEVMALWNKLLDRVVEARMNTVTFYVPWDFHEPAEGVFDFDGTLDRDGDGNADYPSRDLKSFIQLVKSKGISRIMVRPGPYINAEWGPVGFGAVPKWFLENYPDSLAKGLDPKKPAVASFQDPVFREHSKRWFQALYQQVLKKELGPESPILFLQLDNETNYFWDSIYERDYHPRVIARYRDFLLKKYGTEESVSQAYGSKVSLSDVLPPRALSESTYSSTWHSDWFLFHDAEIADYHQFLRRTWEEIGVREPAVLFTTCDSFNAFPNGLLPRLDMRQSGGLSMSTMNIYPKTYGTQAESTLNTPMKAAHDARLFAAAHRAYYGTAGDWVMSTETVGGWFPPTEVSLATRQHTYGSLVGSGVKALIIYYFHEGWNWNGEEKQDSELHFDAPLDKDMNPRPAFNLLQGFGLALSRGLGGAAVSSRAMPARVLVAHDSGAQYPVVPGQDAIERASTESAAWFGMLREAGFAVDVGFVEALTETQLSRYALIVWNPPGYASRGLTERLESYLAQGGKILSHEPTLLATKGNVHILEKNLAAGWNHDGYLQIADASARLEHLQKTLEQLGLDRAVEVKTADERPFVHAWMRETPTGFLVAVENFEKAPRKVQVRMRALSAKQKYHWQILWGAEPGAPLVALGSEAVNLTLPADGIVLYRVRAH